MRLPGQNEKGKKEGKRKTNHLPSLPFYPPRIKKGERGSPKGGWKRDSALPLTNNNPPRVAGREGGDREPGKMGKKRRSPYSTFFKPSTQCRGNRGGEEGLKDEEKGKEKGRAGWYPPLFSTCSIRNGSGGRGLEK